jgi:hypothetical protein
MTTLNVFILLIATLSLITIQTERIVAIEQKQSLHQMSEYSFIYLIYHSGMSHPEHVTPYVLFLFSYINYLQDPITIAIYYITKATKFI